MRQRYNIGGLRLGYVPVRPISEKNATVHPGTYPLTHKRIHLEFEYRSI